MAVTRGIKKTRRSTKTTSKGVTAKKKTANSKKEAIEKKEGVNVVFTSSGCLLLDLALGGGFGWGKVVNIIGDEATGKTLLAIEILVSAFRQLRKKLGWFWDDTERGYSFPDMDIWGFRVIEDEEEYSETIEQWMYNVREKLQGHVDAGTPYIYITDCLDAITTNDELDRAKERDQATQQGKRAKGSYKAEKAKMLSEFFRILKGDISHSKCLFIVISQLRASFEAFGARKQRTGGKALDFYASQIIDLKVLNKIKEVYKDVERVTGVVVEAYISKNKLWKPYRSCRFIILFDYGIDNVDSNLCYLFNLYDERTKLPKKIINVTFDKKQFKKRKQLIRYVEENNLEQKLETLCKEKWETVEEALSPINRKPK